MCSTPSLRIGTPIMVLLLTVFTPQPSAAQNVIYVTTTVDKISSSGGCSLKEAIYSSNLHTTIDGVHGIAIDTTNPDHFITTECLNGVGSDTIVLPSRGIFYLTKITDDAYNFMGPTATPMIISNITIQANGATLQWAGAGYARAFAVGTAANYLGTGLTFGPGALTIQNAYVKGFKVKGFKVKGFKVKGGDGRGGGGGGMGAGGAIYVKDGALIIENSTFDSNSAIGGDGSQLKDFPFSGGGGGGLGGNGGHAAATSGSVYLGSGGGGGGSRGDGATGDNNTDTLNFGGEGGGTVFGNFACGANGGDSYSGGRDGYDSLCPGGGGGGGESGAPPAGNAGGGGKGNYGGGGGGGAANTGSGGDGGFGGGGGSGPSRECVINFGASGGNGGFGGGGGVGWQCLLVGGPGKGGAFAGRADSSFGGGGAALGGAIFNHGGGIRILNSTFTGNSVYRGNSGGGKADNGADAGGAIFSLDGHTTINNATISLNHSSGSQGGVVVMEDSSSSDTIFVLENTIISGNGPKECSIVASSIAGSFAGNLIQQNDNCPGVVVSLDPMLGKLQNNQGATPTMAIPANSPAINNADPATSLPADQRGQPRTGIHTFGYDIGAFELCLIGRGPFQMPCPISAGIEVPVVLTVQVSPAGGGTTTPASGLNNEAPNSVVSLSATPNPGFSFMGWTGDPVTDPASPSTSIIMDNNHTVTVNFIPCNCAEDVTASLSVTRGGYVLNPVTGHYAQTVTVKNNSSGTITGPLSLVLDNLSADATLFDATGATDSLELPAGSPYVNVNVNLAAGQSASFALQFADPSHAPITYNTRVLAGPGTR